ncbi:MAG: hypothetical protein ACRDI1_07175 [Actinomycetota bacterium]
MILLALLLVLLSGGIAAVLSRSLLLSPPAPLVVRNYRDSPVPAVGGIVIGVAFVVSAGCLALVALLRPGAPPGVPGPVSASAITTTFFSADGAGIVLLAAGFLALGTIDDLAGSGHARGFRGHLKSLASGRVTPGALKMAGGGALGLVAGALWELELGPAIVDGLLVALTANLVNLFDLRPGRALKVFFIGWIPLAAAAWSEPYLPASAMAAGPAAVWMTADLSERGMLGDGGSNLLGAVAGAGLALILPPREKLIALGVLALFTLAAEIWSFSAAIERVPPLRWLDRLGRPA